jgi:hypothetical protein
LSFGERGEIGDFGLATVNKRIEGNFKNSTSLGFSNKLMKLAGFVVRVIMMATLAEL